MTFVISSGKLNVSKVLIRNGHSIVESVFVINSHYWKMHILFFSALYYTKTCSGICLQVFILVCIKSGNTFAILLIMSFVILLSQFIKPITL